MPEPSNKAPSYGQRIALFGVRAALLGSKRPLVQRASWFANPAEAARVQRVAADLAPFDAADLVKRRCIPGHRKPLRTIASLEEKPYIEVLSKRRKLNALPYSMQASRAAGSVQGLVAKYRQP